MSQTVTEKTPGAQRFQVIPAIDIIDGKCVRLSQGDYAQKKVYNEHPLEVALQFQDAGIRRLHLVDLDGARAGRVVNWKVLETLASKTALVIDFGGGIKQIEDVDIVFNSGAALATVGSLAVKDPALFGIMLTHFGADRFFAGADVKGDKLAVHGWLEQTDVLVFDFINRYLQLGLREYFCTDIAKDGMMQGPSLDLYRTILEKCPGVQLTASGGVTSMSDLHALHEAGCAGAIVGKAIYEGAIALNDLTDFA